MSLHYQGDLYSALKYFHIPGLDWTSKGCTLDSFVFQTAKMVSSVAHRHGREFTVCETYGATGWSLTLDEMKRVLDYLYVLGVNQMCLHGFFYSVAGTRAHECPPSEFFQNPWWTYMSLYSDYTARLGALLSEGAHLCSLGVLVPTRSYWARNHRRWFEPDDPGHQQAEALFALTRTLLELGVDFDFIFDSALSDSMIADPGLHWGSERIDTLIIPPAGSLTAEMKRTLQAFEARGGRLIVADTLPADTKGALAGLLADKRVCADGQDVLFTRRILADGTVLCFAYHGADTDRSGVEITVPGSFRVEEINLETPAVEPVNFTASGPTTTIRTSFGPYQSRMFRMTPSPGPAAGTGRDTPAPARTLPLGPDWQISPDRPNVLKVTNSIPIALADRTGDNIFFVLHCDELVRPVHLILEDEGYSRVTVNDREMTDRRPCRYFDSGQFAVEITDGLQRGENRIALTRRPAPEDVMIAPLAAYAGIHGILPHLFVTGDFAVTAEGHLAARPTSLTTGPWQDQGFPFFAGAITYRTTFSAAGVRAAVLCCDVAGGVAEVTLNGRSCGVRAWAPYRFDLAGGLRDGENTIEIKVTNTALDLLRPLACEVNADNPHACLRANNQATRPSGLLAARLEVYRDDR